MAWASGLRVAALGSMTGAGCSACLGCVVLWEESASVPCWTSVSVGSSASARVDAKPIARSPANPSP